MPRVHSSSQDGVSSERQPDARARWWINDGPLAVARGLMHAI